jgi:plastocyanin
MSTPMKHISRSWRTVPAMAALLAAIFCAAALVSNSRPAAAAAAASAARATITIRDYSFHPAVLTIAKGTRVVWINQDDDAHIVESKDGPVTFQSPGLDTGRKYGFTFRRPGTYHYICSVHPYMHGTVVVR